MMQKRLKQLVIGGAVLAAVALGGSASAGAATGSSSGSSSTMASKASAAPLTRVRGGSVGAMHHERDSWIHDLYLTDHEQYVRHHQRLASQAR
jgi:hypothetical protein